MNSHSAWNWPLLKLITKFASLIRKSPHGVIDGSSWCAVWLPHFVVLRSAHGGTEPQSRLVRKGKKSYAWCLSPWKREIHTENCFTNTSFAHQLLSVHSFLSYDGKSQRRTFWGRYPFGTCRSDLSPHSRNPCDKVTTQLGERDRALSPSIAPFKPRNSKMLAERNSMLLYSNHRKLKNVL